VETHSLFAHLVSADVVVVLALRTVHTVVCITPSCAITEVGSGAGNISAITARGSGRFELMGAVTVVATFAGALVSVVGAGRTLLEVVLFADSRIARVGCGAVT